MVRSLPLLILECLACHGAKSVTCTACQGTGEAFVEGSLEFCEKCQGSGDAVCDECDGEGTIDYEDRPGDST